jgi:hypothetical protein
MVASGGGNAIPDAGGRDCYQAGTCFSRLKKMPNCMTFRLITKTSDGLSKLLVYK